ncbi:phosphatidylinositol 4-phosphate 5-kinase 5 [Eurytemora carolleeae]|uniref:phosphatidylinositol 4-phosphate 5-kinase 5 n=1 Tax=Eurytemora carolleeae TaxID=1294199 RepID=UPI000C770222|nr:phosphatidylinositol 4-phosphate 5-kinase 5 [Eurytemora carolleeae]XP_023331835.1 phosphatidylinositol 4-phosphate 5-kinase 5 [Eurytemora carolleeae]|eukprot:XP_023331834.1 phosphatidylinositol 4-phosphate 5-kinase 5-like [Eurytemora affinis]
MNLKHSVEIILVGFLLPLSTKPQSCTRNVTDESWRELFPFLETEIETRKRRICNVELEEGNYTGMINEFGERDGWGEMRWNNGTLYGTENEFYYTEGDKYLGQWKQNLQQGLGSLYSRTGVYVGEWIKGLQEGNGTALYNNGNKYTGQFSQGFKDGFGVFQVVNGDVYTGRFKKGMRDGEGIESFYNGEKYVGTYREDKQEGQGIAYYSNGRVKYVGEWKNGSPDGNGTYVALNGDMYIGLFRSGVVSGPGRIQEVSGEIREVGENEEIDFRSEKSKMLENFWKFSEFLGLNKFFQKYIDFFTLTLPSWFGK